MEASEHRGVELPGEGGGAVREPGGAELVDAHGNPYQYAMGRSRVMNKDQHMAMMMRPHEERGCCCEAIGCHPEGPLQ